MAALERTTLSALLASARCAEGAAEFSIGEDWLQGRSVFGGLQAAVALAAMRSLAGITAPLRALQMSFIAPVPQGPVRAEAKLLRSGKSVTQVEARLVEVDQTLASVVGVFGAARESRVRHESQRPTMDHSRPIPFPFVPGVVPNFTQHYSATWLRGDLPFTGNEQLNSVVELDLRDPGPCTEAHVLALADFIPPVALSWMPTPTPGSSLTWMLELFGDDYAGLPLSGWRVDSELVAAQGGYTSQSNRLWAPDGRLIALSRQAMVVFG